MNRGKFFVLVLSVLIFTVTEGTSQVLMTDKNGNQISLNGIWKFKYFPSSEIGSDSLFYKGNTDVRNWENINTPGSWELQGFAEPFYGKNLKEGTGLYRTSFTVPVKWKGQPVYVAFDGVQYGYKCWVNGNYTGSFNSSYNRQIFDISRFVKPGRQNIIALRVTTRPKGWEFDTNDCWSLSGIIRDVTLFSLPVNHIRDLVVKTRVGSGKAALSITALIENSEKRGIPINTIVTARLYTPGGLLVKEFSLSKNKSTVSSDTCTFSSQVQVDNPLLWTAETPDLYSLILTLKDNNKVIQNYSKKIGIREITWNDGIFKLNGTPVKLRGVDHHDLSPVNGRSVTEAEMLQDLKLMAEANINFIRTSHYQTQERFIELCDSLGFYVMEEVPFGFGDEHLYDKSYLPILKERARATLWRDKNHPSVIVWSVGNENPLTKICLETGEYVKQLDDTRPYCFPQVGSYFRKIYDTIPEQVDILAPHYPVPSVLREYARRINRPMIVTEYAHALGLDFDRMEALWEIMYSNPKLAGGAVWHFFDQGILRKSPEKMMPGAVTTSVWLDSVTVYDNNDNQGADGLVYANRVPQVDYWQVRKVYSPVKATDDTFSVSPGRQTVTVKLINRYDFTNLSQNQCTWNLYADTSIIESGSCFLDCKPHDTLSLAVDLHIPEKSSATLYYLKMEFRNRKNYIFYEKTYPLQINNSHPDFRKLVTSVSKPVRNNNSIVFGNYTLDINSESGMISLENASGVKFVTDGPYARMGRKATMSSIATTEKKNEDSPLWNPHVLTAPQTKVITFTNNGAVLSYTYKRQNAAGQFVSGTVEYTVTDSGCINVNYRFVPVNGKGIALEAGMSFLIPSAFTEFRWAGKGPYPAYPGKNRLNEFGLYHLNSADINYQGNREDVEVAVFTDKNGNGLAIVANKANIAAENSPKGIIVSHNAYVSGRFNKGSMPEQKVNIEDLKEISGSFSIIPLTNSWPAVLDKLFGKSTRVVVPFKPFYNSYDQ